MAAAASPIAAASAGARDTSAIAAHATPDAGTAIHERVTCSRYAGPRNRSNFRATFAAMELIRGHQNAPGWAAGAAIAIGNFDGVHLGHQALVGRARELARASGAGRSR